MFDLAFYNKIRKNTPLYLFEKTKILSNNSMPFNEFYRIYHSSRIKIIKKDFSFNSLNDDFNDRLFYNKYFIFYIDYFNLSPIKLI
jgi:hypothetical protein